MEYKWRGSFHGLFVGLVVSVQEIFYPASAAQVSPVQNIFSSPNTMDQIYINTPNPKCRLYWWLIEFIDWRYIQSCWSFRPLLWTSAPLTFSQVHLPPPPPFPAWKNTGVCIHGGWGIGGFRQINTSRQILYWSIFEKSQHLGLCVFIDIWSMLYTISIYLSP